MENLNSIWKFINARFTVESDVFTTFLRETDAHSQAKNKYEKSLSKQKINFPDNDLAPALLFQLWFFPFYINPRHILLGCASASITLTQACAGLRNLNACIYFLFIDG